MQDKLTPDELAEKMAAAKIRNAQLLEKRQVCVDQNLPSACHLTTTTCWQLADDDEAEFVREQAESLAALEEERKARAARVGPLPRINQGSHTHSSRTGGKIGRDPAKCGRAPQTQCGPQT